MKTFLAKLRLSFTRDEARPPAPHLMKRIASSEELRRFTETSDALEQRLRNSVVRPAPPLSLRYSIIKAVQGQKPGGALAAKVQRPFLRWLPAPAFALLILLAFGVWWSARRGSTPAIQPDLLASASSALEVAPQVTRDMPARALSPLNEEWNRVDRDVNNTANFLLTSIP